ncbi:MAG: glycoside hydrolase family 73 protein [Aerococcaceae bacterium]|nr:glycoside hydrolase family 73 protein [Aerococcaceae bacterium]
MTTKKRKPTTNYRRPTPKKRPSKPKTPTFYVKNWSQKALQVIGALTLLIVFLFALVTLIQRENNGVQDDLTHTITQSQKEAFIRTIAPTAQRLQEQYGVLASVAIAQAMIESQFGQSQLAAEYNNLFGVKTSADDPQGIDFETQEFIDGKEVTITDRFKVYASWEESLEKHAELIYYGTSWNAQFYQAVLDGKTYQEQAQGLQSSGYATDPNYAQKIISVIEEWQLTQYDE